MIKYLEKDCDFESSVKEGVILVDFYADWCGPCQMLGSILEEQDFINVLKINVDEHMDIATKFGVMSIPTMLFYNNGELKEKVIGLKSIEEIKDIVDKIKASN